MDPHIPKERVHHTAEVLRQLGAEVSLRLYRNMDHAVNHDEIKFVRDMLARLMRESWSLRFMTRLCAIRVLSGDIE